VSNRRPTGESVRPIPLEVLTKEVVMASLSLTGPSHNPDLDHTRSHSVYVNTKGTTVDGIDATIRDVTDPANPGPLMRCPATFDPGSDHATVTVRNLSDNRLYLLRVRKPLEGGSEVSATLNLDTRPAGVN
jgi:hypothetical protein